MRSGIVYRMDVPHREAVKVRGYLYGDERASRACAIVGSTRGNEAQQAYICARLVSRLEALEREGALVEGQSILVIPCANPYSMNILHRFWPSNDSDVNRAFPGSPSGTTTERLAAGIMRVARTYAWGIQLCSFNQPGDFLPHVRVTHQGPISDESLAVACDFGLPYVLGRKPSALDNRTLNYAWQAAGTHAFSLYSRATDRLDQTSASQVEDAILRFLAARGIIAADPHQAPAAKAQPQVLREDELVSVRTEGDAGFLVSDIEAGERVEQGQELARILDAFDAHVLNSLRAPVAGRVFFMRKEPLVQQHMVVFRIAPEP